MKNTGYLLMLSARLCYNVHVHISLTLTVLNEAESLPRLLDSIVAQTDRRRTKSSSSMAAQPTERSTFFARKGSSSPSQSIFRPGIVRSSITIVKR